MATDMSAAWPIGKAPIFIMSFNRPDYLERVLASLRGQRNCELERRPVVLFQDGAVNPHSGKRRAADEEVEGCVRLFRQTFPQGLVRQSPHNLGVAMNFDRAERFGFEEMQSASIIFLEDDLVLERDYIAILDSLTEQFADDPRVGYLAAYGDHRMTLEQQQTNSHRLQLLYHNWGFVLYRRQWLRMRPKVMQYLDIVRDTDYAMRDDKRIRRLFASWGYGCPASSQDAAKTLACCADNVVKLNTWTCHATYIGVRGVHMTEQIFAALRYEDTVNYPERPAYFDPLDDVAYAALLKEQRDWAGRPRPEDLGPIIAPPPAPGQMPTAPPAAPAATSLAEGLVRALYRVVLRREPDAAGLAFHVEQMRSQAGIENSVRGFFRSAEFRAKLGQFLKTFADQGESDLQRDPDVHATGKLAEGVVTALYRGLLGREPEPDALRQRAQSLAGETLPMGIQRLADNFLKAPEFADKFAWRKLRETWAAEARAAPPDPNARPVTVEDIDPAIAAAQGGRRDVPANFVMPPTGEQKRQTINLVMTPEEGSLFAALLRSARRYVEFGTGGSTLLAGKLVRESILSIDSSREWLQSIADACAQERLRVRPRLLHVDIGKVGDWGRPVEEARRDSWPDYHTKVWWLPESPHADLYFVDGRFRVACFAQIMLRHSADALVAFHDFAERPNYHVVREIADEVARAGNLSVFRRRTPFDSARAEVLLAKHRFDPG